MKKLTTEEFIKKAINVHGNKYDYSKVNYKNSATKVCIICHEHGEFYQTPHNHLHGQNCPFCIGRNIKHTKESFVEIAKQVHNDKYDYSKTEYINNKTKVCIICPEHGEFWQTPKHHLRGDGCPKCIGRNRTTEEFIEKAKQVHGDKYDYSKTEYKNTRTKLKIICLKHGEFWQTPHSHLLGNGCPICRSSHLENEIKKLLDDNDIQYEYQKKFKWLGRQSLDFFIPDKNIAIECQGSQHFYPYYFFGGKKKLNYTKILDTKKNLLCKENGIKLLYYGFYKGCIKNKQIILNNIL
jgi:hypothetical protein